jgi:hypothetical protein
VQHDDELLPDLIAYLRHDAATQREAREVAEQLLGDLACAADGGSIGGLGARLSNYRR